MALRKASCSLGESLSRTRAIGLAAPSSHSPIRAAWAGAIVTIVRRRSAGSGCLSNEVRAVEVSEDTADGGQGQAQPGGQFAHGDRAAAKLLERGDVPGAERRGHRRRGAVLPAPHPADDAGKQVHQLQAQHGML